MATLWQPYAIEIVGGGVISVKKQSLSLGNEIGHESTAGSPYARTVFQRGTKPMIKFSTDDIRQAISVIGAEGAAIKAGGTYTEVNLYEISLDECGRPIATGAVHRKISSQFACVYVRQMSARASGDAELDCEVYCLSEDGVSDPFTVTNIAIGSLPALPIAEERYAIGPLKIGGQTIDRLSNLTVDFGVKPEQILLGSAVAPTFISVDSVLPMIEFGSHAAELFSSSGIPIGGLSGDHANSSCYFRQRKSGGNGFWADEDAKHIKFTMDGAAYLDEPHSADSNKPVTISGKIYTKKGATSNNPIVPTVNSVIT
jgi:hypothetical protein